MEISEEETGINSIQKMGQGYMGLGMLVQRQVMPRWVNDNFCLNDVSRRDSVQGRVRSAPSPPPYRNQVEGGEGQSGSRRME